MKTFHVIVGVFFQLNFLDIKASLKRRLGGRVTEVPREPIKSVGEISIKKRLTMLIGSSNQGTIKTVTGNGMWDEIMKL